MKMFRAIIISLLAAATFIGGAILKSNSAGLDIYLGAIWVFILSFIITFSLNFAPLNLK